MTQLPDHRSKLSIHVTSGLSSLAVTQVITSYLSSTMQYHCRQHCQADHHWVLSLSTRQKHKLGFSAVKTSIHKTTKTLPSYGTWQWEGIMILLPRCTFPNAHKFISLELLPSKTKKIHFRPSTEQSGPQQSLHIGHGSGPNIPLLWGTRYHGASLILLCRELSQDMGTYW